MDGCPPMGEPFLDINHKDGVKIEPPDANTPITQLNSSGKKSKSKIGNGKWENRPSSKHNSYISSEKKASSSHSGGCSSSPKKSASTLETSAEPVSSTTCKPVLQDFIEESTPSPNVDSGSLCNPKEKSNLKDRKGKRRTSLPGSGISHNAQPAKQFSKTAAKRSPATTNPVNDRTKSSCTDAKPSIYSAEAEQLAFE